MSRISEPKRTTALISIVLMLAVVATACGGAAPKPTAEPPTPTAVPTVAPTASASQAGISAEAVQVCLAEELGLDISGGFDRSLLREVDGELLTAAFEACGAEQGGRPPGGGDFLGRLADGPFGDPAVQECLTEDFGADFSGGGGFGISEELTAALDECGVDLAGLLGTFGGGGGALGGGGRGGARGGFGGDGSFQECLTEELGEGALDLLRNPTRTPPPELQEALVKCGATIAIPVESGGGIGDGAGPIPIEPAVEPSATSIPVSELTIEQLTCLSGELDPADLANAVIATSSGDVSEITDDVLAALQTCGVGV